MRDKAELRFRNLGGDAPRDVIIIIWEEDEAGRSLSDSSIDKLKSVVSEINKDDELKIDEVKVIYEEVI